MKVSDAKLRV